MEHLDTGTSSEPIGTELTSEPVLESTGGAQTDSILTASSYPHTNLQDLPRLATPHAQKFRLATVLLVIVAVAAVTGSVVFLVNHGSGSKNAIAAARAAKWSDWYPTSTGNAEITQIADHVSPYYLMNASPLDAITPISMSESNNAGITTGSGLTVVVNPSGSATSASSSSNLELLIGKTVAYNICGLGPSNCELSGTATTARMLLLRREALELALYTFKYTDAQNVIAVLPPGHTVSASSTGQLPVTVTVLFIRSQLASLLKQPLAKTLSANPLDVSQLSLWTQSGEAAMVDALTSQGLFTSQVESQQEGGSLLVLSPLTAQ